MVGLCHPVNPFIVNFLLNKNVTPLVSWYPSNMATAKSILNYNLAVAYAIRGELDKSGEILKQVFTK